MWICWKCFFREYEEDAWNRFAHCFMKTNTQISGMPQDIIDAVFALLGDETGGNWLHLPLRQFDGKSASELVKSEKGEKALKAFIMRLPN